MEGLWFQASPVIKVRETSSQQEKKLGVVMCACQLSYGRKHPGLP
jgi:hypothetical protein